jgi:hypothetical protein
MMMDKDFFYSGETVEEFLGSLTELADKYHQQITEAQHSDDLLSSLKKLPGDIRVMVIAEPWSGDVLYYFPVLVSLAEKTGWEVRIFRRDTYPDLIIPYRKDGLYHSIPVFVFYDADFKELVHWVERPKEATRVIDEESLNLRRRLREEHKADWRRETIDELLELFN